MQHTALVDTAAADASSRVAGELTLRAGDVAQHMADSMADEVMTGDREAIRASAEYFQRDETLLGVVVRSTGGEELYSWHREAGPAGMITRSAAVPVRVDVQTLPGINTPQTLGELEVEVRSFETSPDTVAARSQYDSL